MSSETHDTPNLSTFKKLWPFLWSLQMTGTKTRILFAFISLVLSKLSLVLVPIFFKYILDTLNTPHPNYHTLVLLIIGCGGARILSSFFSEIRDTSFATITQRALRTAGLKIFDHLHHLSLRFHLDRQTGGLSRIVERGTKAIETLMLFLTFQTLPMIVEILFICSFMGVAFGVHYAALILIAVGAYAWYTLVLTRNRIRYVRQMNDSDATAQTQAVDSLLNYETVKYFGNERHEHKRYDEALIVYEKAAIQNKWSLSYLNFGQACIISLSLVTMLGFGIHDVHSKTLTIGDLVTINTFLIQIYAPLFNLGFAFREIKLSLVNIENMLSLLDEPYDIQDKENARQLTTVDTTITFSNVSFAYQPERQILKNISFTVPSGQTVALVGTSGAGKSTIARLLFRFYDVTKGSIMINGQDIREYTQESLRSCIGIVPQDTVLFNDTLLYNIAYGCPEAPFESLIEAAKKAEIYDFIYSLPDGFNTRVGERGLKLSGGEKQRVAIARTLLKNPSIFLFDEATSALDTQTEKAIQDNIERISKNRTTVIIAHRLSTIIHADQIVVLDKGEIIEQGTHHELLVRNGVYSAMWSRQLNSK